MTALIIMGVLFIALIVIVPLIEKSKMRVSSETQSKIARWVWPLMIVLIVVQLFMFAF